MPREHEIRAVVPILEDRRNVNRTPEELARLVIEAIDAVRLKTRRDAWTPVYPTEQDRAIATAIARTREGRGWNPWIHAGPVCRCGVAPVDPRDSGECPAHPGEEDDREEKQESEVT